MSFPIFANKEDFFFFHNAPVLPTLEKILGERYSRNSCLYANYAQGSVSCEQQMRELLEDKNIATAVEIGTLFGVGTAMLANYADYVYTLDIRKYIEPQIMWTLSNCKEKIKQVILRNEAEKITLLNSIEFDFAFIDGDHTYFGVSTDFDCVKKCGRVLFHDYFDEEHTIDGKPMTAERMADPERWKVGIKKFVDSLPPREVVKKEPFAYWERCSE